MSLAAPATRDGWSYSGEFHVEASGHNRHRRATVPELKAIFDGTDSSKDRPGHWYEAQLIHYGLPPSKTKGTAKMRLFDAVNEGNLAVPKDILKVEAELKKEWTKREREAKQALKKSTTPAAKPKGSNKRKADSDMAGMTPGTNVNINLSVSIGPQGNLQVTSAKPAAKKAKTTPTPKKPAATKSTPATKSAPATKANPEFSTPAAPRTKQTARRGTSSARAGKSTSSRPAAPEPVSDKPPARTKQTARRSRPFNPASQGRSTAPSQAPQYGSTPSHWDSYDDPPPPYPGSPDRYNNYSSSYHNNRDDDDDDKPLPPLGLLNGRYKLRCTAPPQHADRGEDSAIIFTLDGDALWGSFEIGPLSGILYLNERPWTSSYDRLYFQWRGEDNQGMDHDEMSDGSYVKFLGDGVVAGKIGFYGSMLEFNGYRVSGQGTRSEVSAASMRRQWEERA